MIRELFLSDFSLSSCVWQSTIFLVVGLVSSFILRHRSSRAHQVLFLAMMAAVIVPIMSILVKHYELGLFVAEPVVIQSRAEDVGRVGNFGAPGIISAEEIEHKPGAIEKDLLSAMAGSESTKFPWRSVVLYAWIAASLILAARLLLTFALGVRLLKRALPLDCQRIKEAAHLARMKLGIDKDVKVRSSRGIRSPVIWCWRRRPILLVPSAAGRFDNGIDWAGVLCHELAHWKRRDHISGLLAELAGCILPWHPLLWWAKSRLVRLSEQACDDWVVATGQPGTDYAESLLDLTPGGQMAFVPAVVSTKRGLADRVRRILKDSCGNPRTGALWALAVSIVAACLAIGVACAQTRPEKPETATEQKQKPTKSLREAATDGDIDQIRLHLSIGTAVNAKDKKGRTALHNAARQGHTEIARLLIAWSANVNAKTKNGQTPLHDAAYCGNGEIAELLIVKGAEVNAWDKNGRTPLSLALKSTGGGREVVDLLLSKGVFIPAFHLVAYRGQLKNVRQSLDKRWQVNTRDEGRRTALHYAVSGGQMRVVELLIARGADVNAKNKMSETPLYYAACVGGRNVAELLISKGADVNAKDGEWGLTPLHAAASRGYPEITELLITNGANIMAKDDPSDYTPLHCTAWYKDKVPDTVAVAKILLDKGADVDAKTTWNGTTLTEAADSDNVEIAKLLIDKGADVDAACTFGCTCLWHAVIEGHKDMAELLISNGADVNAQTNQVSTPLHRAVLNNDKDMVELLLANGAKFDVKDHRGFTAFRMAARKGSRDIVELFVSEGADVSTFHLTACMGDLIRVKSLVEQGTDVDAKDELGWTPLYWATSMGRTRVAEFLVSKGADVTLQTEDGNTPLHKAAKAGEHKLVEFFVSKGADVNAQDKRGNTPLHSAVSAGHVAIADFLIAKGASVNMKSTINWTSLHAAAWYGHEAIVELLVTKGADVDVKDHGYGRTPLQWAKQRGHTEIFNLLRKHGAKE